MPLLPQFCPEIVRAPAHVLCNQLLLIQALSSTLQMCSEIQVVQTCWSYSHPSLVKPSSISPAMYSRCCSRCSSRTRVVASPQDMSLRPFPLHLDLPLIQLPIAAPVPMTELLLPLLLLRLLLRLLL